jgi:Cys-rich repeat protein
LKKFGVGLAGIALACFGLANKASAHPKTSPCNACTTDADCPAGDYCSSGYCVPAWCTPSSNPCCCYCAKHAGPAASTAYPVCSPNYSTCRSVCGGMLVC